MWAACGGECLLCALVGDFEVVEAEPRAELVHQVEGGVKCPADGRVVPLAFYVVFSPANVDGGGAVEARDAVPGVEVEPEVAHLQRRQFCHP